MNEDGFPENLRLLCSYEGSIAGVCRRIGIDRSLFNRYLSGECIPSRKNMRKILDFFGVDDSEIRMKHEDFFQIVSLRTNTGKCGESDRMFPAYPELIRSNSQNIPERYFGYYHRYYYTGVFDKSLTKSLVCLKMREGCAEWKNIERIPRTEGASIIGKIYKYSGELLALSDRFHVMEYEIIRGLNLCYTIIYPSYGNDLSWINGIQTWLSLGPGRTPISSAVVLKYLGRRINCREALLTCGTFREDDERVDAGVRERLASVDLVEQSGMVVNELWS